MGDDDGRKLFTGRLPPDIAEDELQYVFGTYGRVVDVHLHEKEGHNGLRSAFVVYDSSRAAEAAIKVLNDVYKFREDSKDPISVAYPRAKDRGQGNVDRHRDERDRRGFHRGHDRAPDRGPDHGPDRGGYDRGYDRGSDRRHSRGQEFGGHDRGGYEPRGFERGEPRGYERGEPRGYERGEPRGFERGEPRGFERGGYDRGYERGHDRGGYERGSSDRAYERGGYERGGMSRGGNDRDRRYDDRDRYDHHARYDERDRSRERRYGGDHGKGGGKGGGKKGGSGNPGNKLYIANLPDDITKDAIDYVFSSYGQVQDIHIMTGRSKSGMAAAFIIYQHVEHAKKCLLAMQQGYEIRPGQGDIIVKYADDQRDPGGGGRSRPY